MLKIVNPGFFTSVQDSGRIGFRSYGVPTSGAMDAYSSQFANAVLGNKKEAAVLEMTMSGPTLKFLKPSVIAISGADMQPRLNGDLVKMNRGIVIKPESILRFDGLKKGLRGYLAIKNGFQSTEVMSSKSMYATVTSVDKLVKDDLIDYEHFENTFHDFNAQVKFINAVFDAEELTVFKGPEFDQLASGLKQRILGDTFKISKYNNRMAYQLESEFPNTLNQIITAPVLPGTIQMTPSGRLIVLMRDCQTTGGYPRVLQLSRFAINQLSQKTTGSGVKFRLKEL